MASKNNLSTKIILLVEAILLLFGILFCAVSVYRSRIGIRKAIQQRMLDIANCASGSVNGDVLGALTEDDVGSPVYNDLYNTLAVFRDNVELEYVYSIREAGEGDFIFTMDLDPLTPASYGDSVKYTEALAKAGRGTASVDEVPYSDQWGEFYSAYSPVFDSYGNVAGIIAVDFSADWFESQLSSQTRSTVLSCVAILPISLLVGAVLSVITVRPFVRNQAKLLEEKVSAESANRAKSDFLANMSHEIRTPINAVLGMNEMIKREDRRARDLADTDAQASKEAVKNIGIYADYVENAGHNLLAIVNDILDFSKIEAGRLDLTEAPYMLSSLINDLSTMTLIKAQDKNLEFTVDMDGDIPDYLSGDEVRVRQILTNLLNNAVKYTEFGSVRFTVRGERRGEGELLLTASVSDTGIGIRPEDIDKLFSKFERLEMERNSTVEGTGLGLVITRRLLDMMGGTINVESEYGKGSVFTVTIPQKIASDVPVGDYRGRFETTAQESGTYLESFRAPNARILLVDDTKINLTVVMSLLKNTLLNIDTALSGAEAVEMAEKTEYDLILMDQRMPGMDGTEALHRIRELGNCASGASPIICLTADAVVGARERYLAEGFTDYLTKPIDSRSLEKLLMRHLPKDKVERVRVETDDAEAAKGPAAEEFESLRTAGTDPVIGLKFCRNDADFYRTVLSEYAHGGKEKMQELKNSFASEDWKDYTIHVHALKSTSKMIGASELSEAAARLEAAASAGDGDAVRAEHGAMLEKYEAVVSAIRSIIPDEASDEDDDVLEFLPDDGEAVEFMPEDDG